MHRGMASRHSLLLEGLERLPGGGDISARLQNIKRNFTRRHSGDRNNGGHVSGFAESQTQVVCQVHSGKQTPGLAPKDETCMRTVVKRAV